MAKIWYDAEVSLDPIKNETIAVIGYGIQGSAQACNIRDSGLKVIVADVKGSKGWEDAIKDGHIVYETPDAVAKADIILFLVPDMIQAKVYKQQVEPYLSKGKALDFAHGAAIHWKWIQPPEWIDVIMLAPKAPGALLRETYLRNFSVPALVAVHQDYTGRAWDRVLALAKAVGCTRVGVIKTTFKEEVETDWFGEQAILCGGVDRLIRNAFETLVDHGYQPEVAYFECLNELKLIVDLIYRYGITGMYRGVSETARYGGLTRGGKVITEAARKGAEELLRDIQSGKFAKEWVEVYEKEGVKAFEKYLRELENHPIERVGRELRKMMWPNEQIK